MSNLWSYPAGMVVDNTILTERTVLTAKSFVVNDVCYCPEFLCHFSPEQLSAYGIKSFSEDAVSDFYISGEPLDVETATHIQRTYPNAEYNEDLFYDDLDAKIIAAEAKYAAKLNDVRDLFMIASLSDGPSMDGKIQVARNEWARIVTDKIAEIDDLLGV